MSMAHGRWLRIFRRFLLACAAACLVVAPTVLPAQSLAGTWVSREPILVCIGFSLTLLQSEYRIDCSLGQTQGTWSSTDTQIHFTPTRAGIKNSVGGFDVWNYAFVDEDTVVLSTGPWSARLTRKRQGRAGCLLGPARFSPEASLPHPGRT